MAKTIDIKTPITTTPANNSKTLTVVVLDEKSNPTEGANVSIVPSDASGKTNNSGEVQFVLGTATKYDVTATADGKTVTIPYYVTEGGATRLVVNPVYIKSVEAKLNPSLLNSGVAQTIGIGLGIVIIFFVIWKLFKRKKMK